VGGRSFSSTENHEGQVLEGRNAFRKAESTSPKWVRGRGELEEMPTIKRRGLSEKKKQMKPRGERRGGLVRTKATLEVCDVCINTAQDRGLPSGKKGGSTPEIIGGEGKLAFVEGRFSGLKYGERK